MMKNIFKSLAALMLIAQCISCKKTENIYKCLLQKAWQTNGSYMLYEYDQQNKPVKITMNKIDSTGAVNFEVMTIEYNSNGLATGFFCNMISGDLIDKMNWIYDSQNHLQTVTETDSNNVVTATNKVTTDEKGRVTKIENVAALTGDEYAYDNYGNFIYDRMENGLGFFCNMTPEYDIRYNPFANVNLTGLALSPTNLKPYTSNNFTRMRQETLTGGQWVLQDNIKTSYAYNSSGFPTTQSSVHEIAGGAAEVWNYDYTNCK